MARLFRVFVYSVVLAFLCMGCETPYIPNEAIYVAFEPRFIVENNSSTAKTISLKKAYKFYRPNDGWDIRSEPGREDDSPVNDVAPSGGDVVLETLTGTHIMDVVQIILSFVLTIDDKHYVGWDAAAGDADLDGILEYGLGYVNIPPGEFNPPAVLMSKLDPKFIKSDLNRTYVTALYGVRITDEGVSFTLYEQKNATE
jgi:hypothetical protein